MGWHAPKTPLSRHLPHSGPGTPESVPTSRRGSQSLRFPVLRESPGAGRMRCAVRRPLSRFLCKTWVTTIVSGAGEVFRGRFLEREDSVQTSDARRPNGHNLSATRHYSPFCSACRRLQRLTRIEIEWISHFRELWRTDGWAWSVRRSWPNAGPNHPAGRIQKLGVKPKFFRCLRAHTIREHFLIELWRESSVSADLGAARSHSAPTSLCIGSSLPSRDKSPVVNETGFGNGAPLTVTTLKWGSKSFLPGI